MSDISPLFALHRYYIWANTMRAHFDELVTGPGKDQRAPEHHFMLPYMSYWYAGLHVVIEGWRDLGLHDPEVDALLSSDKVSLLKRFRNGAFHYQRSYFDDRFMDYLGDRDVVPWVRALNQALGGFFLQHVRRLTEKGGGELS